MRLSRLCSGSGLALAYFETRVARPHPYYRPLCGIMLCRRFENRKRAAASADSGTALDGEAGRRNGQGDRGERSPVDEQLDRAQHGPRVCRGATANK